MSKFKKIFKIAAPIAAGFIPGVGPLAAAALGAGMGALGGGGLKGALLGGLGSYVGGGGTFGGLAQGGLGAAASRGLGMGGTAGAQTLGKALGGAISGSSQGGKGALTGAILGGLGANAKDIGGYVGRQLGDLGQSVDNSLGTEMFSTNPVNQSMRLAGAGKAQLGLQDYPAGTDPTWLQNYAYDTPGSASYGMGPSGTEGGSGGEQTQEGTTTDMNNIGFKDVLGGVNDYYANSQSKDAQMEALRRSEAAYAPYLAAGGQGLASLMRGYNPGDLTQDPSYQFRLAEGQKALERSMAARGMLNSGQALKGITDYGQNMAATAYDDAYRNWFQQNMALANYGQNSTGAMSDIYGGYGDVNANYNQQLRDLINKGLGGQY